MPSISVPVQIRFADLDMAHHVHNAVYLHWFELARMALLRSFIPQGHDWKKQGLILARNEVDYRLPVHLHDQVEVECWSSAIGNKSFDLSYAVRRVSSDRPAVVAEGRSVLVCFDYAEGRTVEIASEWRKALAALSAA